MGTFDSVYKNKILQLEEENRQLRNILNEYSSSKRNRGEMIDVSGENQNSRKERIEKREKRELDLSNARIEFKKSKTSLPTVNNTPKPVIVDDPAPGSPQPRGVPYPDISPNRIPGVFPYPDTPSNLDPRKFPMGVPIPKVRPDLYS